MDFRMRTSVSLTKHIQRNSNLKIVIVVYEQQSEHIF